MHKVNLLRHYGLKPILVFDGGLLPMKGEQENKRARYCMFPGFSISLGFFFFIEIALHSLCCNRSILQFNIFPCQD